jgi:hypothetical protein
MRNIDARANTTAISLDASYKPRATSIKQQAASDEMI